MLYVSTILITLFLLLSLYIIIRVIFKVRQEFKTVITRIKIRLDLKGNRYFNKYIDRQG